MTYLQGVTGRCIGAKNCRCDRYQQLTSFITQALFSGFTSSLPSVMYSAKTIAVDNLDRYFNVSKYSVFHYR